jgi:hypothetical protein
MRVFSKIANKFRRILMQKINPNYLKNKLSKRKGKCKRCGECCKGCGYFKVNKCLIYENRPFWCYKEFPMDNMDQRIFNVKNCGYNFK